MYLLQIPISLCFGTFIDLSMDVLWWLQPEAYPMVITIAREGSCVIVGRCADFILKDWPEGSIVRIFCCSSPEEAAKRSAEEYGEKGPASITRTNQARAAHYQHYTGKTWGDPHNYDLVINTSETGLDEACILVADYFEAKRSRAGKEVH